MDLPAYWLRRPALASDAATLAACDRLLERALADGPGRPIPYQLEVPKWQFLCHAVERANLVLHGSGNGGIAVFEPRQPDDSFEFSNRNAVFAAVDGIWPLYYAILDREHYAMQLCNACIRVCAPTGEPGEPRYFFSISETALARRPWRTGTVYLLPADSFENQPPLSVGNGDDGGKGGGGIGGQGGGGARDGATGDDGDERVSIQIAQAASAVPVAPLAKLTVGPEDFPFLAQIRGHDDEVLRARIAADPAGFPWV